MVRIHVITWIILDLDMAQHGGAIQSILPKGSKRTIDIHRLSSTLTPGSVFKPPPSLVRRTTASPSVRVTNIGSSPQADSSRFSPGGTEGSHLASPGRQDPKCDTSQTGRRTIEGRDPTPLAFHCLCDVMEIQEHPKRCELANRTKTPTVYDTTKIH